MPDPEFIKTLALHFLPKTDTVAKAVAGMYSNEIESVLDHCC